MDEIKEMSYCIAYLQRMMQQLQQTLTPCDRALDIQDYLHILNLQQLYAHYH